MASKDLGFANPDNATRRKSSTTCTVSLLQGDEIFFSRILSRDTSKGFSSHIYQRTAEGVPFKWETQPGTPIHPHVNGPIPPLNPPPAAHGSLTNRACNTKANKSPRSTMWFWKKSKKNQQSKKNETEKGDNNVGSGRVGNFEFGSPDVDYLSSPRDSRYSSYSEACSSFYDGSSSTSSSRSLKRTGKTKIDGLYWGFPWSFTRIMICMATKN
ncbi:hypothetical protein IFM89_012420 [Coptis chinensis]|uniref:Uncharacterized protein n=1 Tax=Coptis chinensis TaxID=261450 RepID=A0A835ICJ6_9MAGN|nr:hypothetical protein IFM89_012420 [Coptis chinensis]